MTSKLNQQKYIYDQKKKQQLDFNILHVTSRLTNLLHACDVLVGQDWIQRTLMLLWLHRNKNLKSPTQSTNLAISETKLSYFICTKCISYVLIRPRKNGVCSPILFSTKWINGKKKKKKQVEWPGMVEHPVCEICDWRSGMISAKTISLRKIFLSTLLSTRWSHCMEVRLN